MPSSVCYYRSLTVLILNNIGFFGRKRLIYWGLGIGIPIGLPSIVPGLQVPLQLVVGNFNLYNLNSYVLILFDPQSMDSQLRTGYFLNAVINIVSSVTTVTVTLPPFLPTSASYQFNISAQISSNISSYVSALSSPFAIGVPFSDSNWAVAVNGSAFNALDTARIALSYATCTSSVPDQVVSWSVLLFSTSPSTRYYLTPVSVASGLDPKISLYFDYKFPVLAATSTYYFLVLIVVKTSQGPLTLTVTSSVFSVTAPTIISITGGSGGSPGRVSGGTYSGVQCGSYVSMSHPIASDVVVTSSAFTISWSIVSQYANISVRVVVVAIADILVLECGTLCCVASTHSGSDHCKQCPQ